MKRVASILLTMVLLFPTMGAAQDADVVDFDSYIAELNSSCPIKNGDNWTLSSFTVEGDTVKVEYGIPASLGSFLSLLTEDADNVKRMWMKELSYFGDVWTDFVDRMVANDRYLALYFIPKGTKKTTVLYFKPSDLKPEKHDGQ